MLIWAKSDSPERVQELNSTFITANKRTIAVLRDHCVYCSYSISQWAQCALGTAIYGHSGLCFCGGGPSKVSIKNIKLSTNPEL